MIFQLRKFTKLENILKIIKNRDSEILRKNKENSYYKENKKE